jgi:mannose-6-phosphate isomerase-like protein (cupin superfamily)
VSVPFILGPGELYPDAPSLRRPLIRIPSRQTDGLVGLGEVNLPPLTAGPNLRVHANEDELFVVLEGMLTVQIGQELHDIAAGGLAWGARGIPHAFANRAQEPLRIMILWNPGGAERVFEEMEEYARTAAGSPEQEVTAAILARYGATRVGPPIAMPQPDRRDRHPGHG